MNAEQIRKWLPLVGTEAGEPRGEWVTASCPLASSRHEHGSDAHPSFGIKIQKGESRVFCFSCNYAGWQSELVIALQDAGEVVEYAKAMQMIVMVEEEAGLDLDDGDYESDVFGDKPEDHGFPEWYLDTFEPAWTEGGEVHPYLTQRGVPWEEAKLLNFRFDAFRHRICIPVREWEGELRGVHGRHVGGGKPTYLMYTHEHRNNPHVWLGEDLVDPDQPIVLAESVFDYTSVRQVWANTLSPLTASVSWQKLERLKGAVEIITMFDMDKAGRRARERVATAASCPVRHIDLPEGSDPNNLPIEKIHISCISC